jgi:phosphoribosylformylglycinamidine synthase
VNRLAERSVKLADFQVLAVPGGFSYGDDVAAGKILAVELEHRLADELRRFVEGRGLAIGICNGFQVLVKAGLLPGKGGFHDAGAVTLASNDSQKYEDRWVTLEVRETPCVWVRPGEDILDLPFIELPVAHAEGKFVPASDEVLERLKANNQVVLRYVNSDGSEAAYPANPNGSAWGVAGITDPTGRVLGLMPHPERHVFRRQHPRWTRGEGNLTPDGRQFFENAVKALG